MKNCCDTAIHHKGDDNITADRIVVEEVMLEEVMEEEVKTVEVEMMVEVVALTVEWWKR